MKLAKFALVIAAGMMMNSGAANACAAQTSGSIGSSQQTAKNTVAGLLTVASNAPTQTPASSK